MNNKLPIGEVRTFSCSNSWRNYYFLKITIEDGTVGWSEFDQNFGSPGVAAVIEQLGDRLIGQDAMRHEYIREDLRNNTRPGSGGVVGQALGAIENAILDAKAKSLGVPCSALLGGSIRDRLRVYWSHCVAYRTKLGHFSSDIVDLSGVKKIAREVEEQGFGALKTNMFRYHTDGTIEGWQPGFGRPFEPGRNVERRDLRDLRHHIGAMREAAGPDIDILLDLNFNARVEGFIQIVQALEDLDLYWVELDLNDAEALARVRAKSRHPIASCETLIGLQQFLPFFRAGSIDVAIIDAPWNGVWQAMKIAAAAEAHEINVACHNFYSHLSTMMNAHFCAAVPNLRIMEVDIDRVAWDAELFTHVPEYVEGHLVLPDRPGWGTEPIEAALLRHPPIVSMGI